MFLVTVIILICGNVVIYGSPRLIFHIHKHQGWLIYLNSAKLGAYCLFFVFIFSDYIFPYSIIIIASASLLLDGHSFSEIIEAIKTIENPDTVFSIVAGLIETRLPMSDTPDHKLFAYMGSVSITTLLTTVTFTHFVIKKREFTSFKMLDEASKVYSSKSYIDDLLLEASINLENVLVSVEEGKCYVGLIQELPLTIQEHGVGIESLRMWLVFSGYRDEKKRFVIVHNYDKAWQSIESSIQEFIAESEKNSGTTVTKEHYPEIFGSIVEPSISIPSSKILSVSKFDPDYYDSFILDKEQEKAM